MPKGFPEAFSGRARSRGIPGDGDHPVLILVRTGAVDGDGGGGGGGIGKRAARNGRRRQALEGDIGGGKLRTGGQIVVHPFENLLIDCARDVGAQLIVRGLRAVADFEYEFQMVGMNRALDASIETVFMMADARRQIESELGIRVFLELYVKVRDRWRDDDAWLRRYGYKPE